MDLLSRFESLHLGLKDGEQDQVSGFIADVIAGKSDSSQLEILANRISQIFFELDVRYRIAFLYLLGHIDPMRASVLAKQDIDNAYEQVRLHAGYLHQVLVSIDNVEPFVDGLSAMEVEKALALAFNFMKARHP